MVLLNVASKLPRLSTCAIRDATMLGRLLHYLSSDCWTSADVVTDSFTVINANKPYATCVRKIAQAPVSSNSTSLTNQANSSPNNKRKVVKLFNKRGENEGGRRLKLKKDVDLRHQGPAVALLRDAGRDPLALVSKWCVYAPAISYWRNLRSSSLNHAIVWTDAEGYGVE